MPLLIVNIDPVGIGWRWRPRAWLSRSPRLGALIASDLSNAPLRANAANRVTGYDQASLLGSGPWRPRKAVEPGPCTMPTPPPRHLPTSRPRSLPTSRPRHLPRSRPRHLTSRWPWRLGLLALGLTTGVLAALVASAILLSPQPPLARRTPVLGLLTVPAEPAARSVATPPPVRGSRPPRPPSRPSPQRPGRGGPSAGRPALLGRARPKRRPRLARRRLLRRSRPLAPPPPSPQ